jgi:streptogramin lyase
MRRRARVLAATLLGSACALATACAPAWAIETVEYRAGIAKHADQTLAGGQLGPIAAGPDGNMWFVERFGRIGRITPAGVATEFGGFPLLLGGIAAGPYGAIWFTHFASVLPRGDRSKGRGRATIGRLAIDGTVTSLTPPYAPPSLPSQIVVGPDGALWYVESGSDLREGADGPERDSYVGIVRIGAAGEIRAFPVRSRLRPIALTTGPDGALWFADFDRRVGRMTTDGRMKLYDLAAFGTTIETIARGSDGNVWFTASFGRVGRITPSGAVTLFHTPSRDHSPSIGLAAGPDGNMWMTDATGGIVKIVPPSGTCVVPSVAGLRYPAAVHRVHRAGCTLGVLRVPRNAHPAKLRVRRQAPAPGRRLPGESGIALTLRRP